MQLIVVSCTMRSMLQGGSGMSYCHMYEDLDEMLCLCWCVNDDLVQEGTRSA